MNADQIRQLALRLTGERQRLLQLGYPESYVAQLSPQQVMNTQGLPLLTGGNELNRDLAARQAAEGALGNRASAGTGLLNTLLAIEQEQRAQQANPFRYGEFLADVSGVAPGAAANPIQALVGAGNYIDPRPSSIMQNSRVQQLLESLFDYGTPQTFQTERRTNPDIGRVRDAYAKSPTAADRFFEEATRNPEGVKRMFGAYAHGGTMMADEPIVGMGLRSRRPRFLVGEEGPEVLSQGDQAGEMDITPMNKLPRFAHGGTVKSGLAGLGKAMQQRRAKLPAQRAAAGEQARKASALEGIDPNTRLDNPAGVVIDNVRYTSGGLGAQTAGAVAGRYRKNSDRMLRDAASVARSPFGKPKRASMSAGAVNGEPVRGAPPQESQGQQGQQGLAMRQKLASQLYGALKNNPFVHPDAIARLSRNELPLPGSITQRTMANLDQNLLTGLLVTLPMAFGISPESYAQEMQRYAVPGMRLYAGR